jgi:hypothetical protein
LEQQSSQLIVLIHTCCTIGKTPIGSHYDHIYEIWSPPMWLVGAPVQPKAMTRSCQFSQLHLNQCLKPHASTENFWHPPSWEYVL